MIISTEDFVLTSLRRFASMPTHVHSTTPDPLHHPPQECSPLHHTSRIDGRPHATSCSVPTRLRPPSPPSHSPSSVLSLSHSSPAHVRPRTEGPSRRRCRCRRPSPPACTRRSCRTARRRGAARQWAAPTSKSVRSTCHIRKGASRSRSAHSARHHLAEPLRARVPAVGTARRWPT